MRISIVITTWNRADLLARSLHCYDNQPFKNFELIIIDDWSEDDTQNLCEDWSSKMNLIYMKPFWKEKGTTRDGASIINYGLRAARGELIILTHPEVMVMKGTLQGMYDARKPWRHVVAKPYFITYDDQKIIDTVPWREDGGEAVRQLPDFYEKWVPLKGTPQYYTTPANMEQRSDFGSQVFTAMLGEDWRRVGGLAEFTEWGSVDMNWLSRRRTLGIEDYNLIGLDEMVVHQNHDLEHPGTWNRDMEKAIEAVRSTDIGDGYCKLYD